MKVHQLMELVEDASVALEMLKDGNERYLKGELVKRNHDSDDREILYNGQKPFAVILTCSDSRVAPEIFFDQTLGNIFTIRNAGNIADKTAIGSIEYAIQHLKSKLIVVCGHSKCGAVEAACSDEELSPNLKHIVEYIMPAVKNGGSLDEIIQNNIMIMVEKIRADEIIKSLGGVVAGAYFDIHSGVVTWLT